MILSTNWEVIQIPAACNWFMEGDIFTVEGMDRHNPKFMRFHGLTIRAVIYGFGIFLHFDHKEWRENQAWRFCEMDLEELKNKRSFLKYLGFY